MNQITDRCADKLRVIGHPVRLKILLYLKTRKCNVTDISTCLGIPQATTSQHLTLMRDRGVLTYTKEGLNVSYTIADKQIDEIVDILSEVIKCEEQS